MRRIRDTVLFLYTAALVLLMLVAGCALVAAGLKAAVEALGGQW